MPFVPRSIARVKPPVCLLRWKLRSSRNRCSNTFRATLRIAFWATLANTAFRSSWKSVAPILVTPSGRLPLDRGPALYVYASLTSYDHRARNCIRRPANCGKVHIHRVDNALEVKWHIHVENLEPTSNDRAVPTRSFVPQSSYGITINAKRSPVHDRFRPYLRPEVFGHFFHDRPICLPLFLLSHHSFA